MPAVSKDSKPVTGGSNNQNAEKSPISGGLAQNVNGARKRPVSLREFKFLATARNIVRIDYACYRDSFEYVYLTEYAPTAHAAELLAKSKIRRIYPSLDWSVVPA